jgi:hypothetical protein
MNAMTGFTPLTGTPAEPAEVTAREGERLTILRHGAQEAAQRAFSCLVEPEPGDLVLVGRAEAETYILAVLARRGAAPMRVAMPDGASIAAEPGARLRIAAGTLQMEAEATQIATQGLDVTAGRADVRLGRVGILAEAIETIAQRVVARLRRSYRFIEETEQVRARDIDQRASGHMHIRGDATTVQGTALVKLQADQIHLG